MLLLFKTNDCLRHAERRLDAGVDSFVVTLRYCLRAMLEHKEEQQHGNPRVEGHSAFREGLHRLRLRLALWLLRLLSEGGGGADAVRRLLL